MMPRPFRLILARRTTHTIAGSAGSACDRECTVYLLLHGVVKIILVAALLGNQLWAYPWTIAFLLAFIAYQLYRLTFAPSLGLVALTVFDAVVAWLRWREYQRQRSRMRRGPPARAPGRAC
jgi:uncharacterized membrane protein